MGVLLVLEVQNWSKHTMPKGNCDHHLENSRLQTERLQMGHFETPVFNILNFRGWIKHIFDTVD